VRGPHDEGAIRCAQACVLVWLCLLSVRKQECCAHSEAQQQVPGRVCSWGCTTAQRAVADALSWVSLSRARAPTMHLTPTLWLLCVCVVGMCRLHCRGGAGRRQLLCLRWLQAALQGNTQVSSCGPASVFALTLVSSASCTGSVECSGSASCAFINGVTSMGSPAWG
jgi:hypothetical protein